MSREVTRYGHTVPAVVTDVRADYLATVSGNSTARMHLWRADALIERVRSLLGRGLTCQERIHCLNEAHPCPEA